MKVLVTGSSGFIGKHVVEALKDHEVVPYDTEIGKDIMNMTYDVMEGVDAVVHLAGIPHPVAMEPPMSYMRINTQGTLGVAGLAQLAGVKKFIYSSSIAYHGLDSDKIKHSPDDKLPFMDRVKRTDYVHQDILNYAASKVAAEAFLMAYHLSWNLDVTILRIAPCQVVKAEMKRILKAYGCYSTPQQVAQAVVSILDGHLQDTVIPVYRSTI